MGMKIPRWKWEISFRGLGTTQNYLYAHSQVMTSESWDCATSENSLGNEKKGRPEKFTT